MATKQGPARLARLEFHGVACGAPKITGSRRVACSFPQRRVPEPRPACGANGQNLQGGPYSIALPEICCRAAILIASSVFLWCFSTVSDGFAQDGVGVTDSTLEFSRDVLPILRAKCIGCHGASQQEGGLRLDSAAGVLQGGDSGEPVFVRGASQTSLIIGRITSRNDAERMPAEGEPLSDREQTLLSDWIDAGALMEDSGPTLGEEAPISTHWSLKAISLPAVPYRSDGAVSTPVDAFLLQKLSELGLTASPAASKSQLIRRLSMVIKGVPPTPGEVAAFTSDQRPDAWSRVVDRALASPRFGERWAQHWLDVVRYADTNGFETNRERKTAYHYRDYVIDSFNTDKPYDQFIREQLAGDALGADTATGFLVAGAYDIVKAPDINLSLMQRQNELDDMVSTTSATFLGLTVGCARCHHHKFDPISQKDYYGMQAVFAGVTHGERTLRRALTETEAEELSRHHVENERATAADDALRQKATAIKLKQEKYPLLPCVNAQRNEDEFCAVSTKAVRFKIATTSGGECCIDELEILNAAGENVALKLAGATVTASGTIVGYPIHKLEHLNDGLYGNDHSWIADSAADSWVQVDFPQEQKINKVVWQRDRTSVLNDRLALQYTIEVQASDGSWQTVFGSNARMPYQVGDDSMLFSLLEPAEQEQARQLKAELARIKDRITELTTGETAWLGQFSQPEKTRRLFRGDPTQPREFVAPNVLAIMGSLNLSMEEVEQQRRVNLANAIASPDNPLTSRVIANRLWQGVMGRGIVSTPSDFGANGASPTHPELLDWLAGTIRDNGWSIKRTLRHMILSSTFQQSSAPNSKSIRIDADGLYFWRFTPRRLEAEAIRDSILATSGVIDYRMGGPGFYLMDVVEENVMHYFPKEEFGPPEFRRMVYLFKIRQATDSVFSSFDCPNGGQSMPRRNTSNTPLQALNLFNSAFVMGQSKLLAARLEAESGNSPIAQVNLAFRLLYAREPDEFERNLSVEFIRKEGLLAFCRSLFNTSEFLFLQ